MTCPITVATFLPVVSFAACFQNAPTSVAVPCFHPCPWKVSTWWRHQMETFSALLAFCAGNSPATGEFPAQRPVTRSFDVFFDLRLNKRLSKQSWSWWFETPSSSLWRHCNDVRYYVKSFMWWNTLRQHMKIVWTFYQIWHKQLK